MATDATARDRAGARAMESATMAEAFQVTAAERGGAVALRTKEDAESFTWGQYADRVRRLAAGLAALGVGRGETVGLLLTNRPEFHFADAAAMHLGAIPFSLYNTSAPEQARYVVEDAANSVLFTEQKLLDLALGVRDEVAGLEHVVVVDGEARGGAITVAELERGGGPDFDFEASWRAVGPDDLLTLIYTSGTTGPPKGVELTHGNMLSQIRSFDQLIPLPPSGRVVSWLPMAHIAERNVSHYLPMVTGMQATCCPDPAQLVAYLPEVRPTWFFAVPRIWEKMKAALEAGFESEQSETRRQAVEAALELGRKRSEAEDSGEELSPELAGKHLEADRKVLAGVRERIGLDRLIVAHVGAAPTPPEVIGFFRALGVPLGELWGLSECCGVATCSPLDRVKVGTVGPPSPGVELRLAADGEVLLRAGTVMAGYRNKPEQTADAIDGEGWLHTGDLGTLDDDGYLTIVDRKKELIISATGKNMSPANIEATIKAASPLIGQACAIGDGRPYNVALIVLDPDAAGVFAQQHRLKGTSLQALAAEPTVLREVTEGIERANAKLARVEQIKRFKLLAAEWQPGGEELTPTSKLKRRPIERTYGAEIEALYAE